MRLSHRSIGEGRNEKIPDKGDADDAEDSDDVSLLLSLILVLSDVDPLGREPAEASCECIGEFGGRSSLGIGYRLEEATELLSGRQQHNSSQSEKKNRKGERKTEKVTKRRENPAKLIFSSVMSNY